MSRTGTATLPLHWGRVPPWLASRMASLGRVITEAIILHYGRDEFLRRLAHPGWFQAFGAVMGMDWHSSGITTSVLAALKRGLHPVQWELGLHVCGGRGNESRKTPSELTTLGTRLGLDADALVRASRLVAKVDSAAIQDGYGIYLHGFIVADDGHWTVVQQGMHAARREARRYHWLSEGLTDFVDKPHAAIDGIPATDAIVNLTDARARPSRHAQLALIHQGPDPIVRELTRLGATRTRDANLELPFHHEVRAEDVVMRRLRGALTAAHERGPRDFADLLLTPGVGPRTVFSLALVAEVVHGAPSRFTDPARHSLAHGGKDGHPYPVPRRIYDETIRVMKDAVARARLGNADKLSAIQRLDAEARRLEAEPGPEFSFDRLLDAEWDCSPAWDGMTAAGPAEVVRSKLRPNYPESEALEKPDPIAYPTLKPSRLPALS